MVLRRCRYIVVSDVGADPGFSFEDLGNAISKIRVDLGVPIRFDKIPMRPRAAALWTRCRVTRGQMAVMRAASWVSGDSATLDQAGAARRSRRPARDARARAVCSVRGFLFVRRRLLAGEISSSKTLRNQEPCGRPQSSPLVSGVVDVQAHERSHQPNHAYGKSS